MLRLSRSLSRFETQDIKTQPQINHYFFAGAGEHVLRKTGRRDEQLLTTIPCHAVRISRLVIRWKIEVVSRSGRKDRVTRTCPRVVDCFTPGDILPHRTKNKRLAARWEKELQVVQSLTPSCEGDQRMAP